MAFCSSDYSGELNAEIRQKSLFPPAGAGNKKYRQKMKIFSHRSWKGFGRTRPNFFLTVCRTSLIEVLQRIGLVKIVGYSDYLDQYALQSPWSAYIKFGSEGWGGPFTFTASEGASIDAGSIVGGGWVVDSERWVWRFDEE